MVKTVASMGRMNMFPTSNDCAVLEQDMDGTDGSKQCQQYRHRLAPMYNSRKAADCADLALAELVHLVSVEGLPCVVLDEPDARQHLSQHRN